LILEQFRYKNNAEYYERQREWEMQLRSELFGVVLNNIPLINLRNEFARYYTAFKDKGFLSQFGNKWSQPIKTPYMLWYGMDDDLISIILQRVIVGIESYLPVAAYLGLILEGGTKDKIQKIRNPFDLGGRGTVDNFYNRLPALIKKEYSLKESNLNLFNKTKVFYKEIRNPIFHGYNLSVTNVRDLGELFKHLAEIYSWIDSWFNLNEVFPSKKGTNGNEKP